MGISGYNPNKEFQIPSQRDIQRSKNEPVIPLEESKTTDIHEVNKNSTISVDAPHITSQLPSERSWHDDSLTGRIATFFRRIAHFFYSLIPNSSPDVSIKLLASLFGEKGIGSNNFFKTAGTSEVIKFMINFMEKEALHNKANSNVDLIKKLMLCSDISDEMEKISKTAKMLKNEEENNNEYKEFHDKITEYIYALEADDYLILPGGIDNSESLYKITKNKDGTLTLEIISHDISSIHDHVRGKKFEKGKKKLETNIIYSKINQQVFLCLPSGGLFKLLLAKLDNTPTNISNVIKGCGSKTIINSNSAYHQAKHVGVIFKNIKSLFNSSYLNKSEAKAAKTRMKLRVLYAFMNQSYEELKNNTTARSLVKEGIRSISRDIVENVDSQEYDKIHKELQIIEGQIIKIEEEIELKKEGNIALNKAYQQIEFKRNTKLNLHKPSKATFNAIEKINSEAILSEISEMSLNQEIVEVDTATIKNIVSADDPSHQEYNNRISHFTSKKAVDEGIKAIKNIKNNAYIYIKRGDYREAEQELNKIMNCFFEDKFKTAHHVPSKEMDRFIGKSITEKDLPILASCENLFDELSDVTKALFVCVEKTSSLASSKISPNTLKNLYPLVSFMRSLVLNINRKNPDGEHFTQAGLMLQWIFDRDIKFAFEVKEFSRAMYGSDTIPYKGFYRGENIDSLDEVLSKSNKCYQKLIQPLHILKDLMTGSSDASWSDFLSEKHFSLVHEMHFNSPVLNNYHYDNQLGIYNKGGEEYRYKICSQVQYESDVETALASFFSRFNERVDDIAPEAAAVIGELIQERYNKGANQTSVICRIFDVLINKPHLMDDLDVRNFIITVLSLDYYQRSEGAKAFKQFNSSYFRENTSIDSHFKENILPLFLESLINITTKLEEEKNVDHLIFIMKVTDLIQGGYKDYKEPEQFQELIKKQLELIEKYKDLSLNKNNPLFLERNSLHKQYLLALSQKEDLNSEELKEILISQAVIANSPLLQKDANPYYDFKMLDFLALQQDSFKSFLNDIKERNSILNTISEQLGLETTDEWEGEYPLFTNQKGIKIDLNTGTATLSTGNKVGTLPWSVLHHEDVKKVLEPKDLSKAKVEFQENGSSKIYKLSGYGYDGIVIKEEGNNIYIFHEIEDNNKNKILVQYVQKESLFKKENNSIAEDSSFTKFFNTIKMQYKEANYEESIPGIFKEDNREFWLDPDNPNTAYIINNKGVVSFKVEFNSTGFGEIIDYRKDPAETIQIATLSKDTHTHLKPLVNFGNTSETTVFLNKGKIARVELQSTNLEFEIIKDKVICKNKQLNGWSLDSNVNNSNTTHGIKNAIVLISPDGKQKKLIVPNREILPHLNLKDPPSGFKLLIKALKSFLFGLSDSVKVKDSLANNYRLGAFGNTPYFEIEITKEGKIIPNKGNEIREFVHLAYLSLANANYENSLRFLQKITTSLLDDLIALPNKQEAINALDQIIDFPLDTPNAIAIRTHAMIIKWKYLTITDGAIPNKQLSNLYENYLTAVNNIDANLKVTKIDHEQILAFGVVTEFHRKYPQYAEHVIGHSNVSAAITENAVKQAKRKLDINKYIPVESTNDQSSSDSSSPKRGLNKIFKNKYEQIKSGKLFEKSDLKDTEFAEVLGILSEFDQNVLPDIPVSKDLEEFIGKIEDLVNSSDQYILQQQNNNAAKLAHKLQTFVEQNKGKPLPRTIEELEKKLSIQANLTKEEHKAKLEKIVADRKNKNIQIQEGTEVYKQDQLNNFFSVEDDTTYTKLKITEFQSSLENKLRNDKTATSALENDINAINNSVEKAKQIEIDNSKTYTFKDTNQITQLKSELQNQFNTLEFELKDQQTNILNVLQHNVITLQKLQNMAGLITKVDWDQLVICFLQQDFSSIEHLIPKDRFEDLKQQIRDYFLDANKMQKVQVALQMIRQIEKGTNVAKLSNDLYRLLTIPNQYNAKDHPHILVMEYLSGFSVRADQIGMINDLVTNPNCIRQAMTGAGKTSVILVLSALLKANGENMVSVMFPKNLFTENLKHLEAKLGKIFDHKVLALEYSMQTPIRTKKEEPLYFERMYHNLLKVIDSKGCVVTTVETMQALEQKWKGLIDKYSDNPKEITAEDKNALVYLAKIIKICRSRQEAMIDEIDKATNPKASNNYRYGNPGVVDHKYEKVLIDIYDILLKDDKLDIINNNQGELFDIKGKEVIESAVDTYIEKYHKDTPYGEAKLKNYLLGKADSFEKGGLEAFIKSIKTDANRDQIVLAKDAFTTFIPLALSKSGNKRYARSQNGNDVVLCSYSDTPREGSEPQELMEKMAYTIQDYYARGVTEKGIEKWYQKIIDDVNKGVIELNDAENLFNDWFEGKFAFVLNKNKFKKLTEFINSDPERQYIKKFLEAQLNSFKITDRTVQNDAFHIASMCKHVAGVTATPPSSLILHAKFDTKDAEDPAVKGKMILNILRKAENREKNISFDAKKPEEITQKFTEHNSIVDASGATRGASIENLVEIAFNNRQEGIEGICFFDSAGFLKVRTAEGIIKKEDCNLTPSELGMVLKEDKARGADVVLGDNNLFVVIVDNKQNLSGILQAVGRSRKNEQHLQFATPEGQGLATLSDVIYSGIKQEADVNAENAFRAQKQKLKNIVHDAMMDELLALDFSEEGLIEDLIAKYNEFKINEEDKELLSLKDLFVTAGNLVEAQGDYYNKHKNLQTSTDSIKELAKLKKVLVQFAKDKLDSKKEEVLKTLDEIEKTFEGIKNKLPPSVPSNGFETDVEVDVSVELDNELDVDADMDTEADMDMDSDKTVAKGGDTRKQEWVEEGWKTSIPLRNISGNDKNLNGIMSPSISISRNLLRMDSTQNSKLNELLKVSPERVNTLQIAANAALNIKYLMIRKNGDGKEARLLDIQDYRQAKRELSNLEEEFAFFDFGLNAFVNNNFSDKNDAMAIDLIVQAKLYAGIYDGYSEDEINYLKALPKDELKTIEEAFIERIKVKGPKEIVKYKNSPLGLNLNNNFSA